MTHAHFKKWRQITNWRVLRTETVETWRGNRNLGRSKHWLCPPTCYCCCCCCQLGVRSCTGPQWGRTAGWTGSLQVQLCTAAHPETGNYSWGHWSCQLWAGSSGHTGNTLDSRPSRTARRMTRGAERGAVRMNRGSGVRQEKRRRGRGRKTRANRQWRRRKRTRSWKGSNRPPRVPVWKVLGTAAAGWSQVVVGTAERRWLFLRHIQTREAFQTTGWRRRWRTRAERRKKYILIFKFILPKKLKLLWTRCLTSVMAGLRFPILSRHLQASVATSMERLGVGPFTVEKKG